MATNFSFRVGDELVHRAFGRGRVLRVDSGEGKLLIAFEDAGEKLMSVQPPYDRYVTALNGLAHTPRNAGPADSSAAAPARPAQERAAPVPTDRLAAPRIGDGLHSVDGPTDEPRLTTRCPQPPFLMCHLDNLESILRLGLLAKRNLGGMRPAPRSIAEPDVQALRANIFLLDQAGRRPLQDYVPLYFAVRTPMLYSRREIQDEIALIEMVPDVLDSSGVVCSDGNAAAQGLQFDSRGVRAQVDVSVVRTPDGTCERRYQPAGYAPPARPRSGFYAGPHALDRLNWGAIRSDAWGGSEERKRQKQAEALVPDRIGTSFFRLLHARTREACRHVARTVAAAGLNLPVRHSPELFFPERVADGWRRRADRDTFQAVP
jgi:hypothetical protein